MQSTTEQQELITNKKKIFKKYSKKKMNELVNVLKRFRRPDKVTLKQQRLYQTT